MLVSRVEKWLCHGSPFARAAHVTWGNQMATRSTTSLLSTSSAWRRVSAWLCGARWLSAVVASVVVLRNAHADAPVRGSETIIVVDRPDGFALARRRALTEAPFLTLIEANAHRGEQQSVASALASAPGTQVRATGGMGAFSSVSVRGAAAGHTEVLVNGVPLARLASVTADLGSYSLEAFSAVELYRGSVPLELSGGGLGGAVNMVTRLGRNEAGERVRIGLGGGSFGARTANAWYGDDWAQGRYASSVSVGYAGARGDYEVYSDNGTPLSTRDDRYVTRAHNAYAQGEGNARFGATSGTWEAGVRALVKRQELPGSLYQPAQQAMLRTQNAIADARWQQRWRNDQLVGEQRVYGVAERQAYSDPANEIGVGTQDRAYRTLAAGLLSQWAWLGARTRWLGVMQTSAEQFSDIDLAQAQAAQTRGNRQSIGLGIGAAWRVSPLVTLSAAARGDVVRTVPPPHPYFPTRMPLPTRVELMPTPRAALQVFASDTLVFKASTGWYARLPTATELFGDRGFVVGSPDLRAERGPTVEGGMVWAPAPRGAVDHVLVEANAFWHQSADTIVMLTQGGFVARPFNIGDSRTYGAELAGAVRLGKRVAFSGNHTLLFSEQRATEPAFVGKELPRVPRHRLYGRVDAVVRARAPQLRGFVDGSWQTKSYLDQGNLATVPARWLLGAGAGLGLGHGFTLFAEVKNLTNRRVQQVPLDNSPVPGMSATPAAIADIAGFPLPGRTLFARLEWAY